MISAVTHHTFTLDREYPASPERLFSAFSNQASKQRWFAEGSPGHSLESFSLDFRVGGAERAEFRFTDKSPFPGVSLVNEGTILDIDPGNRIVSASTMAVGGRRISASLVTAEFFPTATGSRLLLTHQGAFFPGSDGPQLREAGWRELLERLANAL